jgi:hypothetical protein
MCAKRYSSDFVNEATGKHCNLPDTVITKDIPKFEGFSQSKVKDLYQCVEAQYMTDKKDIQRIEKAEKF